jgi:hypothetical protein
VTDVRRLPVMTPVAMQLRELLLREIRISRRALAAAPLWEDPALIGEQYEATFQRLDGLIRLGAKVGWEAPHSARTVVLEGDEECGLAIDLLRTHLNASRSRGSTGQQLDEGAQAMLAHVDVFLLVAEADRLAAHLVAASSGSVSARSGWLSRLAGRKAIGLDATS